MVNGVSRRKFLQASAMTAGGLLSPAANASMLDPYAQASPNKPISASDRIRFGVF